MAVPEPWHIVWKKQCNCKLATATRGRIVVKAHESGSWTATYHVGPVCDACDTPWKLDKTN